MGGEEDTGFRGNPAPDSDLEHGTLLDLEQSLAQMALETFRDPGPRRSPWRGEGHHFHGAGGEAQDFVAEDPSPPGVGLGLDEDEPLFLPGFGKGRTLHRSGVVDRSPERFSPEVRRQNLTPMDMACQDRGKPPGLWLSFPE